ncbi:hypothetical protein QJS04_geneDACA024722 [Acorus gramineus]|uniref:Uncharacterized protein n=1 Tax=Acorus gramineus TaxID=55184 RepID=A0AAV9AU66_ACOGR|nr:hypothetical protein QJS04_geneDACA024722 [Acorus gramineus]
MTGANIEPHIVSSEKHKFKSPLSLHIFVPNKTEIHVVLPPPPRDLRRPMSL